MTYGVLVVGEALIDEVVHDGRLRRHVGGSPANVALGLARLNLATRLHTAIGDDADGRLIRDHLGLSGVTLTPESVTRVPTSRAVAVIAKDGSAAYEFDLTWHPRRLHDLRSPKAIHVGSLGAFLKPGQSVTADIVRRGRDEGALISFDPNARPSLLSDTENCRVLFSALASSSSLVKLSDEDAEFFFPGRSIDHVVDVLLDGGASVVAVTRGGEGAYVASADHRIAIAPIETTVADTVGAGDSFMATLIWALISEGGGWDGHPVSASRLLQIGNSAALAAAITVSRAGADLPRLDELVSHQFSI